MKRAFIVVLVLASALLVVLVVVVPFLRIRAYDAPYARITRGMDKAAVAALLGAPDRVEPEPHRAFWGPQVLADDVAREVKDEQWYTVRRWAAVPISWTVGFDANGRVISKHRWD
jgi:hypothetical protein